VRRGPYAKVVERNAQLLERIRDLKAEHPFWGYRRIWAYLRYVDGLIVNQKRIYGVMKGADLLVKPNLKLRARRKADTTKPRPTWPNQWWGIDMTKVMIEGFGWVYLVVVLDWHTKKVVGHYAGLQARAWHWLVALNRAVNRQFPDGVRDRALNLMADNGCQPTSLAFMRACAAMNIRQAFTSYSNPKGNADTERFLRTLKEELVWLREWTSPSVFFQAFDRWIVEYNNSYLHSALGYRSPEAFEAKHLGHVTPLALLAKSGAVQELSGYLSDPQGSNSYSYSRNNPLRLVDPDGQWAQDYLSGRQTFNQFQAQAHNSVIEVGNATQQLTQDNRAWDFAVSHPYIAGSPSKFRSH
jgi:putative transposase